MSETARSWFYIDEFQYRAAMVLDLRIAKREDLATIGTQMQVLVASQQGRHRISMDYPPEDDIELAATRIRPLFNQDDPVYHGHVMKGIGYLAQAAPQPQRDFIKLGRKAWAAHDRSTRWSLAVSEGGHDFSKMRTDREIARDFIYADLVHADAEARARLRLIPRSERLLAATTWVTDAIKLTEVTRRLIIDLTDAGCLAARSSG